MKKMIAANLVALRAMIKSLRAEYSVGMDRFKRREFRRGSEVHLQWCQVQARLIYLVPLYRALHAVHQQTAALHSLGVQEYQKQFAALRATMRKKLMYGNSLEFHFGGDVAQLQLLVPVAWAPPLQWGFGSIADIAEQVADELALEQSKKVKLGHEAEQARQAFLASLTKHQRELLNAALGGALKTGIHAISFAARDVSHRLVD